MKVILLQDIRKLGKKDQVIEVKDGYAANYLIPNKLAVRYTDRSKQILENQQQDRKLKEEELKALALEKKSKLDTITLEFKAKASKDGRMIGTISYKQVEAELLSRYHIEIDKRKFVDKLSINAFGNTILKIELYKDVIATIKVHVSEEN